jgi:hypothetical protein
MNSARSKTQPAFISEPTFYLPTGHPGKPGSEHGVRAVQRHRARTLTAVASTFGATVLITALSASSVLAQSSAGTATPVAPIVAVTTPPSTTVTPPLRVAPLSTDPIVTITVLTRGKAPDATTYAIDVRCTTPSGASVKPASGAASFTVNVASATTTRITTAEFPTLTVRDECVVASFGGGTDVFYRTTRSPDSGAEAAPGMIANGRYQSAPGLANGRTIEVLHAYTGDFLLTNTVRGPSSGVDPVFTFSVRCDGDTTRIITLGDGQSRLITGVTTGAVCRVEQVSGGSPTFADNSGDANDGVVTIGRADPACWDLRNTEATCRAIVNATNESTAGVEADRPAETDETTTTVPQDQQPASTAAPAVEAGPASPVSSDSISFTG